MECDHRTGIAVLFANGHGLQKYIRKRHANPWHLICVAVLGSHFREKSRAYYTAVKYDG